MGVALLVCRGRFPGPGIPQYLLRTTGDDVGGQDRRDGGCRLPGSDWAIVERLASNQPLYF